MSDTFFKNIHISNFKSLKEVTLSDCKRINLLIGKPNVGKSNILEAIGLFGLDYFDFNINHNLNNFVRLENLSELFFDGNKENNISILAEDSYCTVKYKKNLFKKRDSSALLNIRFKYPAGRSIIAGYSSVEHFSSAEISIDSDLNLKMLGSLGYAKETKYYKFSHRSSNQYQYESTRLSFLTPPVGVNLIDVIQDNVKLKKELVSIFAEYNLKLLFDKGCNDLRIMKETKDGEVFSIPYSSIADTLQRVIFYKTAIASNENSILLFEEPEAHCFPPYIAHFTQDVINSQTNQFFIATHSPYVLNDFLENKRDEVAIFMAYFKDGQTVIYRLNDDEVNEVYNDGIDVFFNYEKYTQHG